MGRVRPDALQHPHDAFGPAKVAAEREFVEQVLQMPGQNGAMMGAERPSFHVGGGPNTGGGSKPEQN